MIRIDVPLTKVAPFYYLSLVVTMIVVAFHLMEYEIPFGIWSIVILMITILVLAFFDYSLSYSVAVKKVRVIRERGESEDSN